MQHRRFPESLYLVCTTCFQYPIHRFMLSSEAIFMHRRPSSQDSGPRFNIILKRPSLRRPSLLNFLSKSSLKHDKQCPLRSTMQKQLASSQSLGPSYSPSYIYLSSYGLYENHSYIQLMSTIPSLSFAQVSPKKKNFFHCF